MTIRRDSLRATLSAHPKTLAIPGTTPAAVLVGVFQQSDELRVWLIRRPEHLRTHRGQVALPGGTRDEADSDLVETALREAEEEIGLPRHLVEVLGSAEPYVTITRYVVTPIVGWIQDGFVPVPNEQEVTRVFSAPLHCFAEPSRASLLRFEALRRIVRGYEIEGEVVWGATAAILEGVVKSLHS